MKKAILFVAVSAFVGFLGFGSIASADSVLPGAYTQSDSSVMGVGQTMMQMGAHDRTLTNATNIRSRAATSLAAAGVNSDYQFGSSQSDQSWKQWRTAEDAGVVVGLVPGDCRGDNSDGKYRGQMNDNRIDPFGNPYMKENLVSQADCTINHPTLK
ncbi:MAG: hypothetical protein HOB18_07075 [Nitrospina sp.]|jgi:hypothetical protein|nr:hypothetical protein [Nitrospina sp.]